MSLRTSSAWRSGSLPTCLRQQLQEGLEVLGVELLGAHELPVDRPQPVAQLDQALVDETLDRFAGLGQHAAVGAEARGLHREDEAVRRLVAPLGPARRLEARIIRAVDFDRGELAAGVFELALLREIVGIEHAAPRLEGPAADADIGLACHTALPIGLDVYTAANDTRTVRTGWWESGSSDSGAGACLPAALPWPSSRAAPPPAVGVVAAQRQPITQSSEYIARIQATNRVNLVARVSAYLDEVLFTEGTEVKKGDLLYRLEQGPFRADVQAKEALGRAVQGAAQERASGARPRGATAQDAGRPAGGL